MWRTVRRGTRGRVLADIEWNRILGGGTVLLGDLNIHNPQWNIHCRGKRDVVWLETLMESHDFICNNKPGKATRPTRGQKISIIDLTLSIPELGALDSWIIDEELATLSHYELIVFDITNLDETVGSMGTTQEAISWGIKAMNEEETEKGQKAQQERTAGREILRNSYGTEELEAEGL